MRLNSSQQVLSEHLSKLLATTDMARMDVAKRMGVSDGTLGRIKYGQANPTLDVVDRIAHYFRVEPWTLLQPEKESETASSPLNLSLLTKCLTHAIALFREERRLPTDQQIATVASALYEGATRLGDFAAAESQARQALERIARDQRRPHHAG